MKWNYYQFNLSITRHFHFYYPIFRRCNSKPKPIDIHFFGFRLSGSSPLYLWMVDNIIVTILANNDKNLQAIKSNTYLEIVLKTNHRNGGEYFQNVGCIHASHQCRRQISIEVKNPMNLCRCWKPRVCGCTSI